MVILPFSVEFKSATPLELYTPGRQGVPPSRLLPEGSSVLNIETAAGWVCNKYLQTAGLRIELLCHLLTLKSELRKSKGLTGSGSTEPVCGGKGFEFKSM